MTLFPLLFLLGAAIRPAHAGPPPTLVGGSNEEMTVLALTEPMERYVEAHIVQQSCQEKVSEDTYGVGAETLQLIGWINEDLCNLVGGAFIRDPSDKLRQLRRKRDRLLAKYGEMDSDRKRDQVQRRSVDVSERALRLENVIRYHTGIARIPKETIIFVAGPGRTTTVEILDQADLEQL